MNQTYTVAELNEQILTERRLRDYIEYAVEKMKDTQDVLHTINRVSNNIKNKSKAEIASYMFAVMLAAGPVSTKLVNSIANSNHEIAPVAQKEIEKKTPTDSSEIKSKPRVKKPFTEFLNAMAMEESSGNDRAVNKYGYIGKYQFGKIAFKDVALRNPKLKHLLDVTVEKFKADPSVFPAEEQDAAMTQLLKNNWHYLRKYHKYIGQTIGNTVVDASGLLAGAHLVGNNGVKKWLTSNGKDDVQDANGEHVSTYVKKFNGYDIPLND